jgi:hypothetical protein
MLGFQRDRGKADGRKLRLFACACLRRAWHLLPDDDFRRAVEETEREAEREGGTPEQTVPWWWRLSTDQAFADLLGDMDVYDGVRSVLFLAAHAHAEGRSAAWRAEHEGADPVWRSHVAKLRSAAAREEEGASQAALLRDVAGTPHRRVPLEPTVLRWDGGLVVRLARAAYEERLLPEGTLDASRLAVLADALEEAGCTDPDILDHLRGPGPHVRGCWPVDVVLGKT